VVTVVSGFAGRPEDLNALGRLLKGRCGVGGSVKDGEVLVQGDLVVRVSAILREEGFRVK
jgi:translation initiation factor 1